MAVSIPETVDHAPLDGSIAASVVRNYGQVAAAVAQACQAAGRDPSEVRLLPVSKTHPADLIRALLTIGCHNFAENRVQEMTAKAAEIGGDASWVLIGHLQRNKVGPACAVMRELQSLDSLKLAAALSAHLTAHYPGRRLTVLVEVNTSGEATKSGVRPDEVVAFTESLQDYPVLQPVGLMTVAHPDPTLAAAGFARLSQLRHLLQERDGGGWAELSMGMSHDFESAIAHGSTCVRIGTAIFGVRSF